MAETAMFKLEEMLPEATYFIERDVFTREEMKTIMDRRRLLELGVNSRAASLKDYMSYINHEIQVECDRRDRYEKVNIKKSSPRDFSIVQRIHSLFNRCLSKYSSDISMWNKYIEFCSTSGSSSALTKVIMRAIKRHPRAAAFRVIAADRELQQGGLVAARKLLMRAVRVKTDDRLAIWQQLLKLECAALHRIITMPLTLTKTAESPEKLEGVPESRKMIPSCQAALVVYRHGAKDLAEIGKADAFKEFATEALDALEMSVLGYETPRDMEHLRDAIRQ
jgi:hypothetical protein